MDDTEGTLFIAYVGGYIGFKTAQSNLVDLCAVAPEGALAGEDPLASSARLRWTRGGREYRLRVRLLSLRRNSLLEPLAELIAKNEEAASELEYLKRADAIVFLANDRIKRFPFNEEALTVLRSDLAAAGRLPNEIPLIFQIDRNGHDGYLPLEKYIEALTWSHCDHLEAFPAVKRGSKETLDRLLDLYEEARAEHGKL